MVRHEDLLLYLYGVYFKHTRFVIDGNWAGFKNVTTLETKKFRFQTTSTARSAEPIPDHGCRP